MKNNIKTLVLAFTLSICSVTAFASNASGEEDFVTMDNPAALPGDPGAPINDYLIPMLLFGIILGYRLLRKKTQEV